MYEWRKDHISEQSGTSYFVVLTHRYNAVRGHTTGANNSGAEDYLRRKNIVCFSGVVFMFQPKKS